MNKVGILARVLIVCALAGLQARAATVLLSEDFDGTWSTTNPPAGWTIYFDGDTSSNDWHRAPDSGPNPWPDNPTGYALLDSAPRESGSDSLITPPMDCSRYNVVVLRCSTLFSGLLMPYTANLMGSVGGGPFDILIANYNGRNVGPALETYDLTWAGNQSQVRLAWCFEGQSWGVPYWAIDNVHVIADSVDADVGCVGIVAPADTIDSGAVVNPQVWVKNFKATPADSFTVSVTIGGDYRQEIMVENLPGGESTQVGLPAWNAAGRGSLPVTAWTTLFGDSDPSNDTARGQCYVRVRDVGPVEILAPRDTVDSGGGILPQATIRNFGTDTASCYVFLRINAWVDSQFVDFLPPGENREVAFAQWQATGSGFVTARCSTAWSLDANRINDTIGRRFFVRWPHFKDLAATAILRPGAVVRESSVVLPSGIIGGMTSEPASFTAHFKVCNGGALVYEDSQPGFITPGGTDTVDFLPWMATPQGGYTDTLRVVAEGDRNPANDTASGQFQVLAGFHDVGVVAITSPADTAQAGAVVPGAVVKNYGTAPEMFTVRFKVRRGQTQVYEDSALVAALNPDESTAVAFPAWTAVAGSYTARCTTDLPGDIVPTDDWLDRTFIVESLPPPPPGWHEAASMPHLPSGKDIKDGGWLVYDPGLQLILGAKGNKQPDFYAYFAVGDTWKTLMPIPLGTEAKPPSKGACACTDGNGTLFATKGNNKLGFYSYSFSGDSWHQLKDVPLGPANKKVKGGTSSAYVYSGGQPWVYLLKGYKNEFYRYDPAADTWSVLPDAPVGANLKWDKGSWLVYDGTNTIYAHKAKYDEFYAFNTDANTWSPDSLHAMPRQGANGSKKPGDGGSAAWFDGTITALKGGNTQEAWRYTVSSNSWTELDTIPAYGSAGKKKKVKAGGSIVAVNGNLFFAIKGNKTREFWRYGSGGVGVREAYTASAPLPRSGGLSITPNPTTGLATVHLDALSPALQFLSIYDIRGNLVARRAVSAQSALLDCHGLVPGVYFVLAEGPGLRATCRLVRD